jgi:Pyruvate/2-oxoacid:ferredoxin oxidoreductase gamma subunit
MTFEPLDKKSFFGYNTNMRYDINEVPSIYKQPIVEYLENNGKAVCDIDYIDISENISGGETSFYINIVLKPYYKEFTTYLDFNFEKPKFKYVI